MVQQVEGDGRYDQHRGGCDNRDGETVGQNKTRREFQNPRRAFENRRGPNGAAVGVFTADRTG